VLAEFGTIIHPDVVVRVYDSTADCRYLVLPMPSDKWKNDEFVRNTPIDELKLFVSRDSMIGTTIIP
jgi:hypothetical protein